MAGALLLLVLLKAVLVRTQFSIVVETPRVTTPTNQLANGDCCLSSETPPSCTSCPNLSVKLCFREDRHNTDDRNIDSCSVGSATLSVSGPARIRSTVATGALTYTGAYQVLIEVTSGLSQLVDTQLVWVKQQLINEQQVDAGQFFHLQVPGLQKRANLTLSVAVTCSSLFQSCPTNSSCVPRDDLFGHYTCGAGGEIVCLPGFQDPASYCIEKSQSVTQGGGESMTTPTQGGGESMTTPSQRGAGSLTTSITVRVPRTESTTLARPSEMRSAGSRVGVEVGVVIALAAALTAVI